MILLVKSLKNCYFFYDKLIGMVKSSGKVGLFPCILCEPLEESDSEEKTEDSIDSPLSSCAPPNISPPKTPNPMQQQHSTVSQKCGQKSLISTFLPCYIFAFLAHCAKIV